LDRTSRFGAAASIVMDLYDDAEYWGVPPPIRCRHRVGAVLRRTGVRASTYVVTGSGVLLAVKLQLLTWIDGKRAFSDVRALPVARFSE
jgi:hypothetical protein